MNSIKSTFEAAARQMAAFGYGVDLRGRAEDYRPIEKIGGHREVQVRKFKTRDIVGTKSKILVIETKVTGMPAGRVAYVMNDATGKMADMKLTALTRPDKTFIDELIGE